MASLAVGLGTPNQPTRAIDQTQPKRKRRRGRKAIGRRYKGGWCVDCNAFPDRRLSNGDGHAALLDGEHEQVNDGAEHDGE